MNYLATALDALAKCHLALQDFESTEAVLRELETLVADISLEDVARERYLTTKGYYYTMTGRAEEGCRLLAEVLERRQRDGRRLDVVCSLVNLACGLLNSDEPRRAVGLLKMALDTVDSEIDPPRIQLNVHTSLVLACCEAGMPGEAEQLLPSVRRLAGVVGGWYARVYGSWLEGTLARVQERFEDAEAIFNSVAAEFRQRRHLAWYVEASLDLARTYLRSGEINRLPDLATELHSTVEELGADRRVRLAVRGFARAVSEQRMSEQILASLFVALGSRGAGARWQSN